VKTFFEYLSRSGRVPAASLARAQVEQLRRLPSFLEIAEAEGLLSPEALIKVLELQDQQDLSFAQACRDLGLWTAELDSELRARVDAARTPLADLLSADASLSPGLVQELWAAYRAGADHSSPAEPVTAAHFPPDEEEHPPELPASGDILLDESLREAWALLAACPEPGSREAYDGVMHAFHRLKGTLRFQGPAPAERWADFGEQAFRLAAELGASAPTGLAEAGRDALRAIAAEGPAAPPAPPASRKEELVLLLKTLRRDCEKAKNLKGESA
jgi:hypothetical protein